MDDQQTGRCGHEGGVECICNQRAGCSLFRATAGGVTSKPGTTTLAGPLLDTARAAGRKWALDGGECAPPSYTVDQMQTAWVQGWDEAKGTARRVQYHGEVLKSGNDFATIESEVGGYAPLVTLTLDLAGGSGQVQVWLDPSEAAELSRHLKAACEALP